MGRPIIDAKTLEAKLAAGENLVILDSRPMDEYRVMSIPDGIDVPGAELAYRVHDLAPTRETQVVVNCAGRTRSIIGAQALINAGIANPVVALENGTMGWHLAGLTLEHGQDRSYGEVSAEGQLRCEAVIERVGARFGVSRIDRAGLARWQAEAEQRTLYLVDVRSAEEFEAGHLPGAIHAPGGQLVQSTDAWLSTLGARVVLVDDALVRAVMTASWLIQMGWRETAVLEAPFDGVALERGWQPPIVPDISAAADAEITPSALDEALRAGAAQVLDFALSRDYRKGHIPGAWFAVRARLASALPTLPGERPLVLTSPDGVIARLAAPEASELTARPIKVLAGGTAAWRAAGLPFSDGFENMADEPDDVWLKPYDHDGDVEQHMRDYLTWEVDLVDAIERDGDHRFRLFRELAYP